MKIPIKDQGNELDISFLDLLFNLLIGFIVLFVLANTITNPPKIDDISRKAEFIMTIDWPDGQNDDVDLWVQDPVGNICFFERQNVGFMALERDDLGKANDYMWSAEGEKLYILTNHEVTTVRGLVPGRWTVNIHLFNNKTYTPVVVKVKILKLNPRLSVLTEKTITLTEQWQEVTVLNFNVNKDGYVSDLNSEYVPLVVIERPESRGVIQNPAYEVRGR